MQGIDQNIDLNEKAKFDGMGEDWWNPDGRFKTLHDINPVRLQFIEQNLSLSGLKILDIGCGGGILCEALATKGAIVTGLDISDSAINTARRHASGSQLDITYIVDTVEHYADNNSIEFDLITCMEMLEHVPNPQSIISTSAKLLKPGGRLFLSTINRTVQAYLFAVLGAEYMLKLLPIGTHDYSRFIRPSELTSWCYENGFEVTEISGITYIPIINHFNLSKYPNINYLIDAYLR